MNKKELEYRLVSIAERFPDRVGRFGHLWDSAIPGDTNRCIYGQLIYDIVGSNTYDLMTWAMDQDATILLAQAIDLNNLGVKWGDIVKQLGLVPGEQPAEVNEQATVTVTT